MNKIDLASERDILKSSGPLELWKLFQHSHFPAMDVQCSNVKNFKKKKARITGTRFDRYLFLKNSGGDTKW